MQDGLVIRIYNVTRDNQRASLFYTDGWSNVKVNVLLSIADGAMVDYLVRPSRQIIILNVKLSC
jgi:hypothetical protein